MLWRAKGIPANPLLYAVPARSFSAQGAQEIPSSFVKEVPSIAFALPDLEADAKLELKAKEGGEDVGCIQSTVSNGNSVDLPAVSYVAAGIAAAALGLSALGALTASGQPGASTPSPSFTEVILWFQGLAMNGMHSVDYPPIYRKFSKNFAFSTGLIPWSSMQMSIDNFRQSTGGNLTEASYEFLQNATLIYGDDPTSDTNDKAVKRGVSLVMRQIDTAFGEADQADQADQGDAESSAQTPHFVEGIQGYVEQFMVPETNTFMTVLLVFAIVIAAVAVSILLFKVILEAWSLIGRFPPKLVTFRKEYWRIMAQTITNLIFLLYGVWTLYSIFQFTRGDSWAAKLLAGLTLAIFTAVLAFWTWRIWQVASKLKKEEGDAGALYENKETWKKYKIFYENYKRGYWWLFIPVIIYMFAKGCVLASANGQGMAQTASLLVIEAVMLGLLLWRRPFERKSGNWINIVIQVVRVLSVVCILVFTTELGVTKTTKTVTGIILIAVQSALTLTLAILIAVNAIITCVRENPHRRRRKEAEKLRDLDDLTPLDDHSARASMLMQPPSKSTTATNGNPLSNRRSFPIAPGVYEPYRNHNTIGLARDHDPSQDHLLNAPDTHLVGAAAPLGYGRSDGQDYSRGGLNGSNYPYSYDHRHSQASFDDGDQRGRRSPSPPPSGFSGDRRQPAFPAVGFDSQGYSAPRR